MCAVYPANDAGGGVVDVDATSEMSIVASLSRIQFRTDYQASNQAATS